MAITVLPIVAVIVTVSLLIPIAGVIIIVRLVMGGGSRKSDPEETRIMQEIYGSLSRMEQRLDALETLVLDKDGAKEVEV